VFSTLFGGNERERSRSITVDASGASIVSGSTQSKTFPTPGGFQTQPGGASYDRDAFLIILNSTGTGLTYGTYLGGQDPDFIYSNTVDATGVITVAGYTASSDYPTTSCSAQPVHAGGLDGFVTILDPSLPPASQLLYSTFLGGADDDEALDVEPGEPGTFLVCGYAVSADFPVTAGAYDTTQGGNFDAMVLSLDPTPYCPTPPVGYCTAGFSASGCQAIISAVGTASATAASGFDLLAASVEGAKDGMFFYGTNGRQAKPWGNGTSFNCVVPPVKRGGLLTGTGTLGACDGAFAQDLNARWCPSCPKPTHNPGFGVTVQAQLWYRDPFSTDNQTTSFSNAVEFLVGP
jgi:hypothetical protein